MVSCSPFPSPLASYPLLDPLPLHYHVSRSKELSFPPHSSSPSVTHPGPNLPSALPGVGCVCITLSNVILIFKQYLHLWLTWITDYLLISFVPYLLRINISSQSLNLKDISFSKISTLFSLMPTSHSLFFYSISFSAYSLFFSASLRFMTVILYCIFMFSFTLVAPSFVILVCILYIFPAVYKRFC